MVQQGKSWPLLHGLPDAVVSFAGFVLETAMIDSLRSGALHEQVQKLLYTAEQEHGVVLPWPSGVEQLGQG